MDLCAVDMREVRISFVENQREVDSSQHDRIHRQLLSDSRENSPQAADQSQISPYFKFS